MTEHLQPLIEMSRALGEPARELVILGEGNTSAHADEHSFWVKASGTQLAQADGETFVRVRYAPVLAALEQPALSDEDTQAVMQAAQVEGQRSPSIETFLHAVCLQLEGVQFVGHTHPTAAVGLLCSARSRELFSRALFPDQIVLLGADYVYVPYADPGLPLARNVRREIEQFVEREPFVPRVILLENHGVLALGGTTQEVLNITQMLVKTCRVLSQTLAAGGPRFLSEANVRRIENRPDERQRREELR